MPAHDNDMDLIAEYLEHERQAGHTDATIRGRREMLTRLNATLPYGVGQTSTAELAAWLYNDAWSRNTKATYYTTLRSFYGWAASPVGGWINFDPTCDLEKVTRVKGVARPVTDDQLRRLLTESAQPFRMWATIAAYQGLRCIEISRLDREFITEDQLIVAKGKGGRPRVLDTHPDVWSAVRDMPAGPVARTLTGDRASAYDVSMTSAIYFRRELKMPGVSLHRLRHWLGVTMQREYRDIRVTQRALGHASLDSTQIYTAATDDQLRAARAMLPRLAG